MYEFCRMSSLCTRIPLSNCLITQASGWGAQTDSVRVERDRGRRTERRTHPQRATTADQRAIASALRRSVDGPSRAGAGCSMETWRCTRAGQGGQIKVQKRRKCGVRGMKAAGRGGVQADWAMSGHVCFRYHLGLPLPPVPSLALLPFVPQFLLSRYHIGTEPGRGLLIRVGADTC